MKKIIVALLFLSHILSLSHAQMFFGRDTLYGNEWIDYQLDYYKLEVAEDKLYSIGYQDLLNVGLINNDQILEGKTLQMHHMGEEVPLYTSTEGVFGEEDYIVFYGKKNDGTLDRHLYPNQDHHLHPNLSFFTDTSSYFLSIEPDNTHLRIKSVDNKLSPENKSIDYCWQTQEKIFSDYYSQGRGFSGETSSRYEVGEGFYGGGIAERGGNERLSLEINTPNVQLLEEDAIIELRGFASSSVHRYEITFNDEEFLVDEFTDWAVKNYEIAVPSEKFRSKNEVEISATANNDDKIYFSSYKITYPAIIDASGQNYFEFALSPSEETLQIEIQNFQHNGIVPILYDLKNNIRIEGKIENELVQYAIPADAEGRRSFAMIAPNAYAQGANFQKRAFVKYPFDEELRHDYIVLTHPKLFTHSSGTNYVQEYVDYRKSPEGGAYNPIIVDVTQIYDQFGYGVKRHEQSIKNFLYAASLYWKSTHLFLLGKGVDKIIMLDQEKRISEGWDRFDLVPPFGFPHSDYLFVMGNEDDTPRMAVGRIAAYNAEQFRIYFDKIIDFEAVQKNANASVEEKAWMKRILHFAGGDALIQNQVKADFTALSNTITGSTFGGDVTSFFKTSVDIVQEVPQTEQVRNLIDDGAAMIVFYGHSSPTTLDFDIGKPDEYNNKGRYPLFYAIGCNTNRVFDAPSTLSEDYVFIEDKGTIGFFGSTSLTQLTNLSRYARGFYENFGNDSYGETIGEVIRSTIIDYEADNAFISQHIKHVLMYHGDPTLKLYPHEYPDFVLNTQKSSIKPSLINAQADSFQTNLNIVNIGRGVTDSLSITINQVLPDNKKQFLTAIQIPSPKFEMNLSLNLPVLKKSNIIGKNQLEIILDLDNKVKEGGQQAENNNIRLLTFFVVDNDIEPVYPKKYSIVQTQDVVLQASSTSIFSDLIKFHLEIDTTERFNSNLKKSVELEQKGGLISWRPSLNLEEGEVYYWRISIDSTLTSGQGFNWKTSSFTYLPISSKGWSQSHYEQVDDNELSGIAIEDYKQQFRARSLEFGVTTSSIGRLGYFAINITKDGFTDYTIGPCGGPDALWMAAYDSRKLEIRRRGPERPGTYSCWGTDHYLFNARLNTKSDRERAIDFIDNEVNDGDYVFVIMTKRPGKAYELEDWLTDSLDFGKNLFQLFEENGATQIRNLLERETPYLLIFQKGNSDFQPLEKHALTDDEVIQIQTILVGNIEEGGIKTKKIGPASSWESLLWKASEVGAVDSVAVDVIGIDKDENENIIYENIIMAETDLSQINAKRYPWIKLNWSVQDVVNATPAQLDYWRVLYEPLPELALAPNLSFDFQSDTLQRGEFLKMKLAVANTSLIDVDSIDMRYTLIDEENREQQFNLKEKALSSQDTLIADFNISTTDFRGTYQLLIEANPEQSPEEQFFFNNTGVIPFFVQADERNPLLDVTFDGARIMNGDIVAAKPQIVVNLRDENRFLALNDTSLMNVGVLYPSGELRKFHFGSELMEFFPADENNLEKENIARIEFQPIFTESGIYQLQLLAKDRANNQSGDFLYTVDFEVITESQISNVFNYPNPFSTSTQFVFTLTGADIPEDMRIQIMTVSGRMVREISMAELGNVRVGNNRSEFKWDGTDEFGDRLANGVYLYRVLVKGQNDVEFEKFENDTDQYFEGGIGKMVIIR